MNSNNFSRDTTLALKGVAILFMVFAHLFNNMSLCGLCHPFLYINDEPLVYYMVFAMNPVHFFVILSGYGLYIAHNKGLRNNTKRIVGLYIHYWITLLIFVIIVGGGIIGQDNYPGTIAEFIYNLTGWKNNYNHETWFLLPYILLVLSSTKIFSFSDRTKPINVFVFSFSIYIAVRIFSRFDAEIKESFQIVRWIESYLTLQFPFILGMLMSRCWKYSVYKEKIANKIGGNHGLFLIIVILVVGIILLRYKFQSIFYPFYSAAFIMCFSLLDRSSWIDKFLMEMGRRSTSIWFIHTYFCYYFFQNFIYGFKYPLVIYVVLISISFICAIVIDKVNKGVQKILIK